MHCVSMRYKKISRFPLYEAADTGHIRRVGSDKVLKPFENSCGYLRVNVYYPGCERGGKSVFVHRLVAETFLVKVRGKESVNHKNGDKQDNSAGNLEWVDGEENMRHAKVILGRLMGIRNRGEAQGRSVLLAKDVQFIRNNKEAMSQQALADMFGITQGNVSAIILRKSWKHI